MSIFRNLYQYESENSRIILRFETFMLNLSHYIIFVNVNQDEVLLGTIGERWKTF